MPYLIVAKNAKSCFPTKSKQVEILVEPSYAIDIQMLYVSVLSVNENKNL